MLTFTITLYPFCPSDREEERKRKFPNPIKKFGNEILTR